MLHRSFHLPSAVNFANGSNRASKSCKSSISRVSTAVKAKQKHAVEGEDKMPGVPEAKEENSSQKEGGKRDLKREDSIPVGLREDGLGTYYVVLNGITVLYL